MTDIYFLPDASPKSDRYYCGLDLWLAELGMNGRDDSS
jgi:hypothetical protein